MKKPTQEFNKWLSSLAVLMIRFGHVRYPYPGDEQAGEPRNSHQAKN